MHEPTVDAREAARILGVKRATLYAYVSRGRIRAVPDPNEGRKRRYLLADIQRVKARADARSGHTAVAAGALDWGDPVIDSAITRIDPKRGPVVRGRALVELAEETHPFEQVAEHVWKGSGNVDEHWACAADATPSTRPELHVAESASTRNPIAELAGLVAVSALDDPRRHGAPRKAELRRARWILRGCASYVADRRRPARNGTDHEVQHSDPRQRLATVLAGPDASPEARDAIDTALIVVADHELNASTFAARVAAAAGADLYASIGAALHTLSGTRHGGICLRIEALIDEALRASVSGDPGDPHDIIHARLARGDSVPGFGHLLYPDGDPRSAPLLERARVLLEDSAVDALTQDNERSDSAKRAHTALALADAMVDAGHPPANVDFALVTLAHALGLPRNTSAALFAIGRMTGYVAHVLEQRTQPGLLRPRARFTG